LQTAILQGPIVCRQTLAAMLRMILCKFSFNIALSIIQDDVQEVNSVHLRITQNEGIRAI